MNISTNPSSYTTDSSESKRGTISPINPTDDSVFTIELEDVTTMTKILQELHHNDDQSVLIITRDGIRIITAGEKTFQVSAFFSRTIFSRFKFDYESHGRVTFRFILRDLIESLNLLRDDPIFEGDRAQQDDRQPNDQMKTTLYIQYRRKGGPLKLKLENKSNYVISCKIKAFKLPNDSMFSPLSFTDTEEIATIHLNSKRLYEYVSGLDLVSSDYIQLVMARGNVPLKLSTRSTVLGEVELEITENERDIITRDIVVSENCMFSFSYKTQFMKPALEALRSSTSMQMRCGSNGLLSIEHFHDDLKQSRDEPMSRPDNGYLSTHSSSNLTTDYGQPQNKRSSVEYFILSEAKPYDACPD